MPLSPEQEQEIAAARAEAAPTRRAVVPALEEILYAAAAGARPGFVRVIDYMGDDGAIVQAARVSYGRGTKQVSDDRGLINYLMRMRHTSPFEMCELKLHVKLPIFVARQWIRHRTASVNEYSARYSVLQDAFYGPRPSISRCSRAPTGRVAARCSGPSRRPRARARSPQCRGRGLSSATSALLNGTTPGEPIDRERAGLARELARMVLPLNTYTEWYWKIDLHNLLHFIALRVDPHAQYEIRAYALVLHGGGAPLGAARRGGVRGLPSERRRALGQGARRDPPDAARARPSSRPDSGLSAREWRELQALLETGLKP